MLRSFFDSERVQSLLNAQDIDVLIACRPEHFSYISGIGRSLEHRCVHEHTTYALLTRNGNAAVIIPFFELETFQEESWVTDIVPFRQFADTSIDPSHTDQCRAGSAQAELAERISQMGLSRCRIGFDERFTPVSVHELLRAQLPRAHFVPSSDVFERLRQVKTPVEIERLAQSARIVEKAYQAMFNVVKVGVTELELASQAHKAIYLGGAPPLTFMHCGAGIRSSIEHLPPSDYAARNGELIRFDIGVRHRGYHSDIGRTFACGQPTSKQVDIYRRILDVYQEVIQAMKPGTVGRDVYEIYRKGMGEYYSIFPLDWVAHGIGLELHEPPYLGAQMNDPLEPGMVFAVEIPMDFVGQEGYHVEDPILITADGNRRLIDLPNDSLIVAR